MMRQDGRKRTGDGGTEAEAERRSSEKREGERWKREEREENE